MVCAVVQSVGVFGNGVTSVTTGAITTTTGNLIHADSAAFNGTANAMVVTDSKGNTYAAGVAKYLNATAQVYCQSDYASNATGGGSHTFTLSLGGSGFPALGVVEISGADTSSPLDLHESTAVTVPSASPSFTTSGTTAQADEIAIGFISEDSATAVVTEASGWTTQYDSFAGNLTRIHNASQVLSSTGTVTYNPTFNLAQPYSLHITTYKAAASGISGAAAWNEVQDNWAGTGTILVSGSAAWTEGPDIWAGTGTVVSLITGAAAWTEAPDAWAGTGAVLVSGAAAWTEGPDIWSGSGTITLPAITGTAAWTELQDAWSAIGNNGNIDTHDPGLRKRRKKEEERRQKQFDDERLAGEARRARVADAFETKSEEPEQVAEPVAVAPEDFRARDEAIQRQWNNDIERDDEEILVLI